MNRMSKLMCALLALAVSVHAQAPAPDTGRKAERRAARAERSATAGISPDYADLSYGPYPSDKLDLWLTKTAGPAPLVVFIHGGGFVGGDKSSANPASIRKALDAGASFAAINYRFRTEVPIQVVLRDCARAIQFLRWKAEKYHLDKTRVASMGGSAGAGTSLWLAFHDDMADPQNADPVLRESTRIVAAGSTAGQATYDILRWKDYLGEAVERYSPPSQWPLFYGLKTMEELRSPAGVRIRADVDMLGLITKDDPPVFLTASSRMEKLDSLGAVYHTPQHSREIKKRCDEVGVKAVLKITGDAPGEGADANPIDFLLAHLGVGKP